LSDKHLRVTNRQNPRQRSSVEPSLFALKSRRPLKVATEAYRFAKEGGEQLFLGDLPGQALACEELQRLSTPGA
jgi:hypothetical protein